MKYFISDIHIRHKNILKFTRRLEKEGVEDIDSMEDILVKEWNSVVKPGDTVYDLGDSNFGKPHHYIQFLERVNGNVIKLKGNHCSTSAMKQYEAETDAHVIHSPYYECSEGSQKIVLCHYPMTAWNREHHGAWMLFGHCHNSMDPDAIHGKSMDVGLDALWENYGLFRPISFAELKGIMDNKHIEPLDGHKKRKGE